MPSRLPPIAANLARWALPALALSGCGSARTVAGTQPPPASTAPTPVPVAAVTSAPRARAAPVPSPALSPDAPAPSPPPDSRVAGCEADDAAACFQLARDAACSGPERRRLFAKGCGLGHGPSCASLGVELVKAGQPAEAVQRLERGCELGSPLACTLLGEGHWEGADGMLGLPKSKPKARAYHQRAWELTQALCDAGDGSACDQVALAYLTGRTGHNPGSGIAVPQDEAKGRQLQRKACEELGEPAACRDLAFDLYGTDPQKAQAYRQRACELGLKDLCP